MDAPIVGNYVNWTLSREERQFSMLRRVCTRLSSRAKEGTGRKKRRRGEDAPVMDETKTGA